MPKIAQQNFFTIPHKAFLIDYSVILACRCAALAFYVVNEILGIIWFSDHLVHAFKHLTEWGYLMSLGFTALLVIEKPDRQITFDYGSFFHLLLSLELLITVFYWAFIHPKYNFRNKKQYYLYCVKHAYPMFNLTLEFIFNNIVFRSSSIDTLLIFFATYFVWNIVMALGFNVIVYKMITWRSKFIRPD